MFVCGAQQPGGLLLGTDNVYRGPQDMSWNILTALTWSRNNPALLLSICNFHLCTTRNFLQNAMALTCASNNSAPVVEQLLNLSRATRYFSGYSEGSHLVLQQQCPVVEHPKITSVTARNFLQNSGGSHLIMQQPRPVVERCRQTWVVGA